MLYEIYQLQMGNAVLSHSYKVLTVVKSTGNGLTAARDWDSPLLTAAQSAEATVEYHHVLSPAELNTVNVQEEFKSLCASSSVLHAWRHALYSC